MFKCKEVTRIVSESMDRDLVFHERIALKIHLFMCKYCARYKHQLLALREILHLHMMKGEVSGNPITLPPEVKQRIQNELLKNHE